MKPNQIQQQAVATTPGLVHIQSLTKVLSLGYKLT